MLLRDGHSKDTSNNDTWCAYFVEVAAFYLPPCTQGEESVAALKIPGGTEAYNALCVVLVNRIHHIKVLVDLGVGTNWNLTSAWRS